MKARFALAASLAAAAAASGPAAAMDVATFLAKADALERQGVMALLSSDYGLLKAEVQGAADRLRAERAAAVKARRRPPFCPPADVGIDPKELLGHFRAIPAAQRRRTEVQTALRGLIVRKYPCPR